MCAGGHLISLALCFAVLAKCRILLYNLNVHHARCAASNKPSQCIKKQNVVSNRLPTLHEQILSADTARQSYCVAALTAMRFCIVKNQLGARNKNYLPTVYIMRRLRSAEVDGYKKLKFKVGLALSGGGTKGLADIGVFRAFEEEHIRFGRKYFRLALCGGRKLANYAGRGEKGQEARYNQQYICARVGFAQCRARGTQRYRRHRYRGPETAFCRCGRGHSKRH